MKRRIHLPRISAHFTWHRRYFDFVNNLYFNAHLFSTFNFFFGLILVSFVLGFWRSTYWALTVSLSVYLIYAWARARQLAQGLVIRRQHRKRAREGEHLEVVYEISNETGFSLPAISFRQNFSGVQAGFFSVRTPGRIPPQTRDRIVVAVELNAGMGVKELGDFDVELRDELSLFGSSIEFLGRSEVEVFPKILETPVLRKSISPDSTEFGYFDIQRRGESDLFIGTREYRRGDPVRHINWKLSRKTLNLIVNEFEKNANTYVTLLLDLELNSQIGIGAHSTWEIAKDLALSIAAHEIRARNYVQVLAQGLFVPFGTGPDQMLTLERHFTYHDLKNSGTDHLRQLSHLPAHSQVFFFCPLLATGNVLETLATLKRLRHQGIGVTVFAIDPFREVRRSVTGSDHAPVMILGSEARAQFAEIERDLKKSGIHFLIVDVAETPLFEQLLARARHLLEEVKS